MSTKEDGLVEARQDIYNDAAKRRDDLRDDFNMKFAAAQQLVEDAENELRKACDAADLAALDRKILAGEPPRTIDEAPRWMSELVNVVYETDGNQNVVLECITAMQIVDYVEAMMCELARLRAGGASS